MEQRIILSPVILEDVDFIVDAKTNASLCPYEDDIASDRDAIRKN